MAKGRWTKEIWVEAALRAIAEHGVASVTVEPLAARLGATRGSFYWHFSDRDALLDAAMAAWEELETTRVEERVATIEDPWERMRTLFRIALVGMEDPIPGLEAAIYAHPDHPAVTPSVHRITDRRLRILTHGFRDLGFSPAKARRQAVLSYATYVGWLQLRRTTSDLLPEVADSGRKATLAVDHVLDQLVPAEPASAGDQKRPTITG